jgi:hypothetical protein
MAKRYTFLGSDAARARTLARKPRKPKFALGDVVVDVYGDIAAIDAIYADLQAVEDAGVLNNAAEWLATQQKRPKTPKHGIWYSLVFGHGAGVGGERDLKKAPAGSKSSP